MKEKSKGIGWGFSGICTGAVLYSGRVCSAQGWSHREMGNEGGLPRRKGDHSHLTQLEEGDTARREPGGWEIC